MMMMNHRKDPLIATPLPIFLALLAILCSAPRPALALPSTTSPSSPTYTHKDTATVTYTCINPFTHATIQPSPQQINDNYCDCIDGSDEPLTEACSGINHWAGNDNDNDNDDDNDNPLYFQCPQLKILLPPSRINDGICDCCDGSDEDDSQQQPESKTKSNTSTKQGQHHCANDCSSKLETERIRKASLMDNYQKGSLQRQAAVEEYRSIVQDAVGEMDALHQSIATLERIVHNKNQWMGGEKGRILSQHLDYTHAFVQGMKVNDRGIISGKSGRSALESVLDLSADLRVEYIAAVCQLYGEMGLTRSSSSSSLHMRRFRSCEPLRLAGLDAELIWDTNDDDNDNDIDGSSGSDGSSVLVGDRDALANAFLAVAGFEIGEREEEEWVDPEDELIHDEYDREGDDDILGDDEDHDHYDDDDDDNNNDEERDNMSVPKPDLKKNDNNDIGKKKQDEDKPHEFRSKFGELMRANFHEHAGKVLSRIDDILSVDDEEGEQDIMMDDDHLNDEEDESEVQQENKLVDHSGIDPMAAQMIRNTLSGKIGRIEYGDELAQSAQIMLHALKHKVTEGELSEYLDSLVLGVTNRANMSEADVLEVISILHVDVDVDVDVDSESCVSPYALLVCRKPYIQGPLIQRCQERQEAPYYCTGPDDEVEIPLSAPDGYYGYHAPAPREENDLLTQLFHGYDYNIFGNSDISSFDLEVKGAKKEVEKLKKKVEKLKDEIGMDTKDKQKFGLNGELYSIRDECFELTAGKYTYEVCMFGRSYQKEGNNKGGTDLGKWAGASLDQSTGTRVWKWTGGQKCWNGPKRSATVFVTCGAETKMISADEPNVCEYEFKMESHIGCDDRYRTAHDF